MLINSKYYVNVMAPCSSTLAWEIPWTVEPSRLQSMGSRRVKTQLSDFTFTFHFHALEKEMATHSCSCLENPRDGSLIGCSLWGRRLTWLSSSSSSKPTWWYDLESKIWRYLYWDPEEVRPRGKKKRWDHAGPQLHLKTVKNHWMAKYN